jgi:hypothetical protein
MFEAGDIREWRGHEFMSTGVVYEVPARFWPVRPGGRVAVT